MFNQLTKKVVPLGLSVVFILSSFCSSYAVTTEHSGNDIMSFPNVEIYSPEFPDAYIEYSDFVPATIPYSTDEGELVGTTTATVYVEEIINKDGGTVSSRLLTKQEVESTGRENFPQTYSMNYGDSSNNKGTLRIGVSVYKDYSTDDLQYNISGFARWDKGPLVNSGNTRPSWDYDLIGLTWGGDFDYANTDCSGTDGDGNDAEVTLANSEPQSGLVWQFAEQFGLVGLGYINGVNVSADISKPRADGGGKTTSVNLKYIHSYSETKVGLSSITIGYSKAPSFSATFSGNTSIKTWSLAAFISGVDY